VDAMTTKSQLLQCAIVATSNSGVIGGGSSGGSGGGSNGGGNVSQREVMQENFI